MRKAIMVVLVVAILLAGCAAEKDAPENTSAPTSTEMIEPTAETPAEPSGKLVSDAFIQIDENNSISVKIAVEDGVTKGIVSCFFDGTDLVSEYEHIIAAIYIFDEMDINNYSFLVFSDKDLFSIAATNGDQYLGWPSKYNGLNKIADAARTMGHAKTITTALGMD